MVTFDIESKTLDKVVYKYFPENNRDSEPGIFSISLTTGEVMLCLLYTSAAAGEGKGLLCFWPLRWMFLAACDL